MASTGGIVSEHTVNRLDMLAERVLKLVEPLRIELARSPRDLECAYRLRFRTAADAGWISAAQFTSGMEKDKYDDSALQIVALEDDVVVGTIRIILPATGHSLPIEESFAWQASPPGRIVQVGRLCRDPNCNSGMRVFYGLITKVWVEMRKRNFTECCGIASLDMIRRYEQLGFEVVPVAPPRIYCGEKRWPVLIRPLESSERLLDTFLNRQF
jgi:N-acyl-L-homoserine lactone synthetase